MASRWRRVLVPLAAGVAVALVLAYLTLVVDDKPLFGINPDVQLWIAGILAALFGIAARVEAEARSPKAAAWGAGLGAVGFLVAVAAGMAVFVATSSPYAAYGGWTVETEFDEPFNATTAANALEAQGFNVTRTESGTVRAENGSVSVHVTTVNGAPGRSPNATFELSVTYDADGENVGSADKARQQAREDRPRLEKRFQTLLDAFEADTGWTRVGEPEWESRIAVS